MLRIDAAAWSCAVAPAQGGAILGLTHNGADVLRRSAPGAAHPFEHASFVMAPYANRIARGRFRFAGREHHLAANVAGEAHPLHGIGLTSSWGVPSADAHAVTLELTHAGDESWPWACVLRQRISLDEAGFLHEASVTNAAKTEAPAGLGFHPYFWPSMEATLTAAVDGMWTMDAQQLPVQHEERSDAWAVAPVRGARTIDNCFSGWTQRARLAWPGRALELTASPELTHLHVYAPAEGDFFCLEPVSHRPDAINGPAGERGAMRILRPGEVLSAWMRLAPIV